MRRMRFCCVMALTALLMIGCVLGARAQETGLAEAERNRALLFLLVPQIAEDPSRAVTPREGLAIVANALALALGARDASFDNVAQSAPDEGTLRLRELCMALSRAGTRMGVPSRASLPDCAQFTGVIGRSSYFATRDAAFVAPNGKTYENELIYAAAFCSGTRALTTGKALIPEEELCSVGLEADATWEQAVAASLRLYEALPVVDAALDAQASAAVESPEPEITASPSAEKEKETNLQWIEVTAKLVNVRSAASLESAVLSQASQGQRYRTFGRTEEGFFVIEYVDDEIGYIAADYCKLVGFGDMAASDEVIGTVTVLASAAYVRETPGNSAAPVYTASRGQSFECLGQEGNGWYRIRYGEGSIGYIYHTNCALSWFS